MRRSGYRKAGNRSWRQNGARPIRRSIRVIRTRGGIPPLSLPSSRTEADSANRDGLPVRIRSPCSLAATLHRLERTVRNPWSERWERDLDFVGNVAHHGCLDSAPTRGHAISAYQPQTVVEEGDVASALTTPQSVDAVPRIIRGSRTSQAPELEDRSRWSNRSWADLGTESSGRRSARGAGRALAHR